MTIEITEERRKEIITKCLKMVRAEDEAIRINGILATWYQGSWATVEAELIEDGHVCKTTLCVAGCAVAAYAPKVFHAVAKEEAAKAMIHDRPFSRFEFVEGIDGDDARNDMGRLARIILDLEEDDGDWLFDEVRGKKEIIATLEHRLEKGTWEMIEVESLEDA